MCVGVDVCKNVSAFFAFSCAIVRLKPFSSPLQRIEECKSGLWAACGCFVRKNIFTSFYFTSLFFFFIINAYLKQNIQSFFCFFCGYTKTVNTVWPHFFVAEQLNCAQIFPNTMEEEWNSSDSCELSLRQCFFLPVICWGHVVVTQENTLRRVWGKYVVKPRDTLHPARFATGRGWPAQFNGVLI